LKEKLDKFELELVELEREKESLRSKKKKVDAIAVGKDPSTEINNDLIKKCLSGLRDVEREVDNCL